MVGAKRLKARIIPFFDSKETNHLISLLILQIFLTENRKLKTENGIRGAGDEGFWLDNQGNKRKHYCQDQKQIWLIGLWEKFTGLTDQHCQNTHNKLK
jgi:hypothetical protein